MKLPVRTKNAMLLGMLLLVTYLMLPVNGLDLKQVKVRCQTQCNTTIKTKGGDDASQ